MYYHIKLIGETQVPENPYLTINPVMGWSSRSQAHKFLCLDSAKYILDDVNANGKVAFIEWHDESKNPPHGSWGEVNPFYLSTIGV
jgi:hypothetical protein